MICIAYFYSKLGHPNVYKTKWPGDYGYKYTDFERIIVDSMESMFHHGWIEGKT
jgi:hypothetical protein